MRLTYRLSIGLLITLVFAAGFALIALLVGRHHIAAFDRTITNGVQEFEAPGLTRIMVFITNLGSGWPVIVITLVCMLFLYFVLKHRHELLLFLFAILGSSLFNVVLKSIFHRRRPDLHRLIQETGFSFPSGHSMGAFALYGILTYLLWRHIPSWQGRATLILVSCAFILAIGISRIYLGVHYPSDVLGGYLASGFWLSVSIGIYRRYERRRAGFRTH